MCARFSRPSASSQPFSPTLSPQEQSPPPASHQPPSRTVGATTPRQATHLPFACYNSPHCDSPMPDTVPLAGEAVLEVVSPDGARRYARITQTPFMIGRGVETGNHLQLSDRRISRNCAALVIETNRFYLEDRGQRRGLFVNGEKVESRELQDGDVITFGLEDSYEILFRFASGSGEESIPHLLTRIEHITSTEPSGGLSKLNRLLEAMALLHSQRPLDEVLAYMLDHAVSITDADRGLLLEADAAGSLKVKLARRSGGLRLPPESMTPSQTAIQLA